MRWLRDHSIVVSYVLIFALFTFGLVNAKQQRTSLCHKLNATVRVLTEPSALSPELAKAVKSDAAHALAVQIKLSNRRKIDERKRLLAKC